MIMIPALKLIALEAAGLVVVACSARDDASGQYEQH